MRTTKPSGVAASMRTSSASVGMSAHSKLAPHEDGEASVAGTGNTRHARPTDAVQSRTAAPMSARIIASLSVVTNGGGCGCSTASIHAMKHAQVIADASEGAVALTKLMV